MATVRIFYTFEIYDRDQSKWIIAKDKTDRNRIETNKESAPRQAEKLRDEFRRPVRIIKTTITREVFNDR